jgi:hypothetical protein
MNDCIISTGILDYPKAEYTFRKKAVGLGYKPLKMGIRNPRFIDSLTGKLIGYIEEI